MMKPGNMYLKQLILFIFISQSYSQNCIDYTVTLEQEIFLRGFDVIFSCSFTAINASFVTWETKTSESDTFRDVYTAIPSMPQYDGPAAEFIGRVHGEFRTTTSHLLTVNNVSDSDDFNFWSCVVRTPACIRGVDYDEEVLLTDPVFDRVVLYANGEETSGEKRYPDPVEVTCFAISDPKSTVSVNIEGNTEQSCSRVEGEAPQPWNCSVSVTVDNDSPSVLCTAVYELTGETRTTFPATIFIDAEAATTISTGGATTSAAGGEIIDGLQAQAQIAASSSVIIGAVVAVVAVLIIAAVVGILVHRKIKKQSNPEEKEELA